MKNIVNKTATSIIKNVIDYCNNSGIKDVQRTNFFVYSTVSKVLESRGYITFRSLCAAPSNIVDLVDKNLATQYDYFHCRTTPSISPIFPRPPFTTVISAAINTHDIIRKKIS